MKPHLKALEDSKFGSLWLDHKDRPDPLPALDTNETCQLLIVGGGFTGLWAALQAKEREPDLDIVLVEATFIGNGASGRNGGFFEANLAHGETNGDAHFPGEIERIEELGHINLKEAVASFEKYGIDARYEKVGLTNVAVNSSQADGLRQQYEKVIAAGGDAVFFERDQMRAQVNSPTYLAGLWFRDGLDGIVDPARLCWGLKKTILSLGVRIFEATPLESVAPEGDQMKAVCRGGSIIADKVLMATNAFHNPLKQINNSVIPIWDYQLATEPLTEAQLQSINWDKFHHALSSNSNMFHYYRMTQDKRITWGGGGSVCYYYGSGRDEHLGDKPERFEKLSQDFFETFPQLEGVKFSHRWSGIIASSTRFCMVPGVAFEGRVAWAVGYTGLGVGASRFGARIGLELLGYQPTDIIKMKFVTKRAMNWAPEPLRWIGVTLTRHALSKADANNGRRGLWLKLLDYFGLGFAC